MKSPKHLIIENIWVDQQLQLTWSPYHFDAIVCREIPNVVFFRDHTVLGDGQRRGRHRILTIEFGSVFWRALVTWDDGSRGSERSEIASVLSGFFSKDIGNMTERESKRFEMNPISLVSFDWPSQRNRKSNPHKTCLQTILFKILIKSLWIFFRDCFVNKWLLQANGAITTFDSILLF